MFQYFMSFPQGRKAKFAARDPSKEGKRWKKKPTRTHDQKRLRILKYLNNAASSTKKEINEKCFASDKDAPLLDNLEKIGWLEWKNYERKYYITDKGKEIISLFEQIKNEIDSENEPLFDFFKNYNKFEDDENS